jgi:hypothetical protein
MSPRLVPLDAAGARDGLVFGDMHAVAVCRRRGCDCYLEMALDDGWRQPSPSPILDLDVSWSTF